MEFDGELAEIRFGAGLSPHLPLPESAAEMLARLSGPDEMAQQFPIETSREIFASAVEFRRLRRLAGRAKGSAQEDSRTQAFKTHRRRLFQNRFRWLAQLLLRQANSQDGLRERLALFWADHFSARGKNRVLRPLYYGYLETAIRPHINGYFEDLLIAAVTSPLMLHYLDQRLSIGPNSEANARSKGNRGLNENLARELLELHTLGVGAPYHQGDVRELAQLLTGLNYDNRGALSFQPEAAEPGAETILGKTYGGDPARLEPIRQALRDLARHPATARHLAWKLAVHFTQDAPNAELIEALTASYLDSRGSLPALYETLLTHPAAWQPELRNVKPAFGFMASACRALGLQAHHLTPDDPKRLKALFWSPLQLIGQPLEEVPGPDGWPEEDENWITPQGLAGRLQWAMAAPQRMLVDLPEPKGFARSALGRRLSGSVAFAASAAETKSDAIGLVLSAPQFQRR